MSKKSEVLKIWHDCFPDDSPQWRRMFFDAAYVDDEALTLSDPETGATVSSLLLLPYSMTFQGRNPGVAYIYGAGTLRKYRARGFMSQLMREALREASDRGDTFAALIPARDSLRRYYARFGFATVFYSRPERYTSLHRFDYEGDFHEVTADSPTLFSAFERMMAGRPCCMQHTRSQFLTLMEDARMSGHGFAAVAREGSDEPVAMLWAVPEMASDALKIKELLAVDDNAANAALTALQRHFPERPLTLMRQASDAIAGGNLVSGGMMRIVNAEDALQAVAANHPETSLTVRLTDSLLPENSGVYTLGNGRLRVADSAADGRHIDLDINPQVLAAMLFSSQPVTAVTGLPARRPRMSLMLD